MARRHNPGVVRDAILEAFERRRGAELTVAEVRDAVAESLSTDVPASSVRSYLNLNTPGQFTRTARGQYKLSTARA